MENKETTGASKRLSMSQMWKRKDKRIIYTYSLGEMGYAMYASFIFQMMNIYLTDIVGVKALTVGYLNVASRLVKIATGPLTGVLFDKRIFKKGKYWPWMLYVPMIAMVVAVIQFAFPLLIHGEALVPCVIGIVLCSQFMDGVVFTGYHAMFPAVTPDAEERVFASTVKTLATKVASWLQGVYFPFALVFFEKKLFPGNQSATYLATFATIIVIAMVMYGFGAHEVKISGMEERDVEIEKKTKVSAKVMLIQFFTNGPLLMAFLMEFIYDIRTGLLNPVLPYYFQHVAGNMAWYAGYQTAMSFISFIFIALTPWLCKVLKGAKWTYVMVMGVTIFLNLSLWFVRDNYMAFTILLGLAQGISGVASGLCVNFFAAATDYGEWKKGQHIQGLSMSAYQIAGQIANMIGAMVLGVLLTQIGYTQGMEITQGVKDSISMTITKIPTIAAAVATIVGVFMPLTDKKMAQIQKELELKKAADAANVQ